MFYSSIHWQSNQPSSLCPSMLNSSTHHPYIYEFIIYTATIHIPIILPLTHHLSFIHLLTYPSIYPSPLLQFIYPFTRHDSSIHPALSRSQAQQPRAWKTGSPLNPFCYFNCYLQFPTSREDLMRYSWSSGQRQLWKDYAKEMLLGGDRSRVCS